MTHERLAPVYAAQLNTKFRLRLDEEKILELELVQVEEKSSPDWQEQFSAIFRASRDIPLEQRMYDLEHDALGSLVLFLVPVERDQNWNYYEAFFNRLLR